MRIPPPRGHTFLELILVLALAAVILGIALPVGRGALDRWAATAIRDQALAALHRARMEARLQGGATLALDGEVGRLSIRVRDSLLWSSDAPGESGVRITLPDGSPVTSLDFDALGLGIVASRTLLFRRGDAEAFLVVSSRGRGSRR